MHTFSMTYSNNNTHTLSCTQGGDCRRVSTESRSTEGDKYGKFPYTQNTQGTIDGIDDINNENGGLYDEYAITKEIETIVDMATNCANQANQDDAAAYTSPPANGSRAALQLHRENVGNDPNVLVWKKHAVASVLQLVFPRIKFAKDIFLELSNPFTTTSAGQELAHGKACRIVLDNITTDQWADNDLQKIWNHVRDAVRTKVGILRNSKGQAMRRQFMGK